MHHLIFSLTLVCIEKEWDWPVFEFVLENLCEQLQNKSLILGGTCDVNSLCSLLCRMLSNRYHNILPVPEIGGEGAVQNAKQQVSVSAVYGIYTFFIGDRKFL